jgi:hypothetical protein
MNYTVIIVYIIIDPSFNIYKIYFIIDDIYSYKQFSG